MADAGNTPAPVAPGAIRYGRLKQTHPRVDLFRLRKLRALYLGGCHLLDDDLVMSVVFPKHADESDITYNERKRRAKYENLFALVINRVPAGLSQDPLRFCDDKGEDDKLDAYWKNLMKDATPPDDDGTAKTFNQVISAAGTEGLVSGWSWVLVDLPRAMPANSLKEQEDQKALDAYPVMYCAAQVVDWSEKKNTLQWVRTYSCDVIDDDPRADRVITRHCWMLWDATTITKFEVLLDKDGKTPDGHVLRDEDMIPPADVVDHSFGRVPWIRFDTCPGDEPSMHLGDMVESLCRDVFNQQSAVSYQLIRYCFQQLYEFLGSEQGTPDNPISEAQTNPGRPYTRRGPGIVQTRGQDDKAMYVGPDTGGIEVAQASIEDGRDAVMRVTGQMALAQDTSGAALKRSADSKKQDSVETEVAIGAVGKRLRSFAVSVAEMLAIGHGGEVPNLAGYEEFSMTDGTERLEQLVALQTAKIPSATFEREFNFEAAIALLGDDVDPKIRDAIRKDLEQAITQEQHMLKRADQLPPGTSQDAGLPPLPEIKPPVLPGQKSPGKKAA